MPTKIEWAQESWNPVTGCTKVSPGCKNCYAERMARRLAGRRGYPEAPHHFDVTLRPERLEQPLKWRKPRTVFVCSMGDLFHEDVPMREISRIFEVTFQASRHVFLILTKRPSRALEFYQRAQRLDGWAFGYPNVWLGVTAENQQMADERIPLLLQTPAAVRFVSVEPMLGRIKFRRPDFSDQGHGPGWLIAGNAANGPSIDWVIAGGESGPGARPAHPDWFRSLRDQCQAAGVAFFMKQMSRKAPIPDDLMIREFPNARQA